MTGESISRRRVLQGAASAATLAGVGAAIGPMIGRASQVTAGELPIRMAMHIHASFSEGSGSMQAHLAEAERTGVDVIWWTEHDHRMVARNYVTDVHFNGLTEWTGAGNLTWQSSYAGQIASSSATIVSQPTSENDPGDRALRVSTLSTTASGGTRTVKANPKNYALNTSIDGTTISVYLRPVDIGEDAWFDIVIETSYRPSLAGRPAGRYRLRYRVGGGQAVGTVTTTDPLNGLIVLEPRVNRWTQVTLDPVADFSLLWPDIDFRDAALTSFAFAASSRNSVRSTAVIDGLHFERVSKTPNAVLGVQRELMDHYTPLYPTVVQQQGVELSASGPHLNWLGNPDIWPASEPANLDDALAVAKIHEAGGVASYNHPYGSSGGPYSPTGRTSKRRSVTALMVAESAFGADIVEVGYPGGRAGMAQSDYVSLWDVLSRNLVFATGVGVSDDHDGESWTQQQWRHITGVWAQSTQTVDLQTALRAGRAWFCDPVGFSGTIDVVGAGFVPMGSAGLVHTNKSTLKIRIPGVPSGWSVVVVSGVADEVGTARLDPAVTTRSYPASDLVNGTLKVQVSSAVSRFHRLELRDGGGETRAYSNPLWLLRSLPQVAVPALRWAEPGVSPSPSDSVSPSESISPSPSDSVTPSDTVTPTTDEPTPSDTVTVTDDPTTETPPP